MAQDHSLSLPTPDLRLSEEVHRGPSDDSTKGLLRSGPKPLDPHKADRGTYIADPDVGRSGYDRSDDEAPPPRHPSRQMMRWDGPTSEYPPMWDDERRPYGRRSYDYGPRAMLPPPPEWYGDHTYYNPPYRRGSTRSTGHSGPPRRARRVPQWNDFPEEDESIHEPQRKRTSRMSFGNGVEEAGMSGGAGGGGDTFSDDMRLPFSRWMNQQLKTHFVATLGEFVGTTMFLFFAFAGTQVANVGTNDNSANTTTNQSNGFSPIVLLYIALSFGFSLMVNVWIFFRISGGLFNPAVTLAMLMTKSITFVRAFLLLSAQMAGAMFSSFIVSVLFPASFNVRTTLSAQTSLVQGVFIEATLTAELVFTIFMLAKEKHRATFMAPVGIGMALFIAELVGVYYTGGSLNPARSFGPCVITGSFDSDHWVYWVGPGAGAIAAVGFYKFIKILEYEMANPGQDETSEGDAAAAAAEAATPRKKSLHHTVQPVEPKETV